MTARYEVCPVDELPPGDQTIVDLDKLPHSIGVFNVDGEYYALANLCPHQLAPLCEGRLTGETVSDEVGEFEVIRDGEFIQCPWHGWKFDITDGTSVFNPHEIRTRTYEVTVDSRSDDVEDQPFSADAESSQADEYRTELQGAEPPVETYEVDVEEDIVVLYL